MLENSNFHIAQKHSSMTTEKFCERIDDNKRDDLTLGDNSIDDFKIVDNLDFTVFMSCISNLFVKL